MKTFIQNALIIGGTYFVISFIIPSSGNIVITLINTGMFFLFIITLVTLCFKKSFKFIENLQNKMPKICNYLTALGVTEFLALFFTLIIGGIDGYNTAQAKFHGEEYQPVILEYLACLAPACAIILISSLLWATYASFIKPRLKK